MPRTSSNRCTATSANAVWLDSSLVPPAPQGRHSGPDRDAAAAAERSRFSILADDGGTFGQSVRHRSGTNRITAGCATAEVPGPFFRWLETVWGRKAVRGPEGYPVRFHPGLAGLPGL